MERIQNRHLKDILKSPTRQGSHTGSALASSDSFLYLRQKMYGILILAAWPVLFTQRINLCYILFNRV